MDDTIYRQDAIDAILHNQEVYSNNFGDDPIDKYTIAIIDNDAQTIAQLPSAQPERPRGEWIMTKELDEDVATCPFCGAEMRRKSTGEKPVPPNFCSKCGADLKGGRNYETD